MAYLPPPEEYAACAEGVYDYMKMEMASCFEPDLMGVWVLTQLNHWDHELERCVILSEDSLYIVKYDFKRRCIKGLTQQIPLKDVTDISIGTICYPEFTLSPRRCNLAIKLNWGHRCCPKPTVWWNWKSDEVPHVVLMSHPLSLYKRLPSDVKQRNFSIFDFAWPFLHLIKASGLYKTPVYNVPICIETYLGLGSIVYNSHEWGYDKLRKGYVGMWKCDTMIDPDVPVEKVERWDVEEVEEEEKKSLHCSRDDSPLSQPMDPSVPLSDLESACGQPRTYCISQKEKSKYCFL